jgi:hypothetical protein
VAWIAIHIGMEEADIEFPRDALRVATTDIFTHIPGGEALSVDDHVEMLNLVCVRAIVPHHSGGIRESQAPRYYAVCIMISADGDEWNAFAMEPSYLPDQELACAPVFPRAVVKIPGSNDEIHVVFDGVGDEVGEGFARGVPDFCCGGICFQTSQGTVDVQIGAMQKAKRSHSLSRPNFR